MTDLGLAPQDLALVKGILRQHIPGRRVTAFGSRATQTHKTFSDLDLAVHGKVPLAAETLRQLQEAFSASDLPIRVDIVDLASASASFKQAISDTPMVPMDF